MLRFDLSAVPSSASRADSEQDERKMRLSFGSFMNANPAFARNERISPAMQVPFPLLAVHPLLPPPLPLPLSLSFAFLRCAETARRTSSRRIASVVPAFSFARNSLLCTNCTKSSARARASAFPEPAPPPSLRPLPPR